MMAIASLETPGRRDMDQNLKANPKAVQRGTVYPRPPCLDCVPSGEWPYLQELPGPFGIIFGLSHEKAVNYAATPPPEMAARDRARHGTRGWRRPGGMQLKLYPQFLQHVPLVVV
jgi:hypothetical protein